MYFTSRHLFAVVILLLLLPAAVHAQDDGEEINPPFLTYESPSGSYSFTYPTEWQMLRDGYGSFTFVNSGYILYKLENDFHKFFGDELLISLKLVPNAFAAEIHQMPGNNAAERLVSLTTILWDTVEIGTPEALPNGIQRVTFRQGEDFEGMLAVWDLGPDVTGVAMVMTAPGNFAEVDATTQELLMSFQLNTTVEATLSELQGGSQ